MAPHPVARKLRELMGEEAGNSMVDWLDEIDAHYVALRAETRADIAELRHEMQVGFAEIKATQLRLEQKIGSVDSRLDANTDSLQSRLDAKIDSLQAVLRAEMQAGFASVRQDIAQQISTQLKWGIGLWMTSLAATVGILGFLRLR